PVIDALAQRLHDHAIDEALGDHLAHISDVVAVMGGHGVLRTDPVYGVVADLGRSIAAAGWHVASGGGPGAMEAANLGAWLSGHDHGALDAALALLAHEPDFTATDRYLRAGQAVLDTFVAGRPSVAVPTWFYGHEPT